MHLIDALAKDVPDYETSLGFGRYLNQLSHLPEMDFEQATKDGYEIAGTLARTKDEPADVVETRLANAWATFIANAGYDLFEPEGDYGDHRAAGYSRWERDGDSVISIFYQTPAQIAAEQHKAA